MDGEVFACKVPINHFRIVFPDEVNGISSNIVQIQLYTCDGTFEKLSSQWTLILTNDRAPLERGTHVVHDVLPLEYVATSHTESNI